MSMPIITPTPAAPAAPPEAAAPEAPEGGDKPPQPEAPKPTETVDFWKQKAREQETRAKANAAAAQRLQEIEDAEKSDAQRLAEATATAQAERDAAVADALRYKVAATHHVGEDYFDLLGSGDEATMTDRATRLAGLLAAKAENEQLKAENAALKAGKPAPTSIRPVVALKPGASPEDNQSEADQIYNSLFGD